MIQLLIAIACLIYIGKNVRGWWLNREVKRALRPGAGIEPDSAWKRYWQGR